jgi:hypothetical protein
VHAGKFGVGRTPLASARGQCDWTVPATAGARTRHLSPRATIEVQISVPNDIAEVVIFTINTNFLSRGLGELRYRIEAKESPAPPHGASTSIWSWRRLPPGFSRKYATVESPAAAA